MFACPCLCLALDGGRTRTTHPSSMILDALDGRLEVLREAYKHRTGGIGSSLKIMGCGAEQAVDRCTGEGQR